ERRPATRRPARPGRRGDPAHRTGPCTTPRLCSRSPRRPSAPGDLATLHRRPCRIAPGDAPACDARGLPPGPVADWTSWLRLAPAAARPVPGLIPRPPPELRVREDGRIGGDSRRFDKAVHTVVGAG